MTKKSRFILGALLVVVAAAGWLLFQVKHFAARPLAIKAPLIFTLPAGTGRDGLRSLLEQERVVGHTRWLPWLVQLEPELANFKAGTYRLLPGMTVREMMALLVSGKEAQFTIRFIEGSTLKEWLAIFRQAPYMKHTLAGVTPDQLADRLGIKQPTELEGAFYPDTYLYTAQTADITLLKRAGQRMQQALNKAWEQRADGLPYKSPQEMLTMASIVEKETGVKEERARVASVFVNRLRLSMRLQTDPSVIYGMGDAYKGTISRQDLITPTPYNTYMIPGLPPSPIAMPGQASIDAAAHPAKTAFLYFVADGKGGHVFSTNLANHNKAVQLYRESIKENHGQ